MRKFFNLPILQNYIVLLILLISIIFIGSNLVKQSLFLVLPIEEKQIQEAKTIEPQFQFTNDAKSYFNEYVKKASFKNHLKELIVSGVQLVLALPFFYWFWRRSFKLDEENQVQFTVRNFYFYTVVTITMFIIYFSSISTIERVISYNYSGNYIRTIEEVGYRYQKPPGPGGKPVTFTKADVEKVITSEETQYYGFYDSLVQNLTLIIVSLPIFYLHWRNIKKMGLKE